MVGALRFAPPKVGAYPTPRPEAAGPSPSFDPERMEHSRFSTGTAAEKTPLDPETAKKGNKKKRRKGQKKQA